MEEIASVFILEWPGDDPESLEIIGSLSKSQSEARRIANTVNQIVEIYELSENGKTWVDRIYPKWYAK